MRFGIREAIFLVLLLAMPPAAYFFAFERQNQRIRDVRDRVRLKADKLAQLETVGRTITDLNEEITRLTHAVEVFQAKLPAEHEVDVVLKQVWQLAAKHRLLPKSVKTDKPVIKARYTEQRITIVIIGDFDGFYSFLLDLEALPRITQLPRMQLKKLGTTEGQMQADLTLSVFYETSDGKGESNGAGRERL